jgi:nucleotide-binding universal stress UspA family protein
VSIETNYLGGYAMLMLKRILVPLSFAPSSREAFETAVEIARRFESELFVLNVLYDPFAERDAGAGLFTMPGDWQLEMEQARQRLDRFINNQIKRLHVELPITKLIAEGKPERRIIEIAREKEIDLIVLAHHEESGLDHLFWGRNIDRIVDRAHCHVLVTRVHLYQEKEQMVKTE